MLYLLTDNKKKNDDSTVSKLKEYPYKKKYLLTKTEYAFYNILKRKADARNLIICPKVRLEDFISVTAKENKMKYRGYIKSRHIDFLICDSRLNILMGIELDDSTHNTESAKKTDNFKNELFKAIDVPLYRIVVNEKDYENKIDNVFSSLDV
jgi:hypothetical protein